MGGGTRTRSSARELALEILGILDVDQQLSVGLGCVVSGTLPVILPHHVQGRLEQFFQGPLFALRDWQPYFQLGSL